MKIALLGRGRVAQALRRALSPPHQIRLGVRGAPQESAELSLAAAAEWADVVILATPWTAETEIAATIAPHVQGKPVINATNPVAMLAHGPDLAPALETSAAEGLQAQLSEAHVVKTFNQIGAEFIADTAAFDAMPVMLAAGDDETARHTALRLVADAGFAPVDAGPLVNARHLESLAMLWIWQAIKGPLGRRFGFALTHKKGNT